MNTENEVRTLLAAVDPPPSRVDIGRAVEDGRRGVHRRRFVGATGIAVAVAALAAVPFVVPLHAGGAPAASPQSGAAPPSAGHRGPCALDPKAVLWVPDAFADRVDPSGRYVGGARVIDQNNLPVVWTDGKPLLLTISAQSTTVYAINASGVVVGQVESPTEYAFRYRNEVVTPLAAPAGYPRAVPEAINAAGTVVGVAFSATGDRYVAVKWTGDVPEILAAPGNAMASGISDDGTVVGSLGAKGGAYLWDAGGTGRKLAVPNGLSGGTAGAIRGGWVVGNAADAQGHQVPVRWNLRTGTVDRLPRNGFGRAVNASGLTVVEAGGHNFVVDPAGAVVTLSGSGIPWAVADNGTVVGYTAGGGPLVWHC
jgi:hypothetical protein